MDFDLSLKDALEKGDYESEAKDEYVKMLEADTKKNLILKFGMGAFYIALLVVSIFIV